MLTQQIRCLGERIRRYQYLLILSEEIDQKFIVISVECLQATMTTYQRLIRGADDEQYEQISVDVASGGHRVSLRLPLPGA